MLNAIIENRIKRLREKTKKHRIDTIMISTGENRRYLSNFTGDDTQFDESAGVLFITNKKQILATDSRYEQQARDEASVYDIYCYKKGLSKEIHHILNELGTKQLGFESARVSVDQYDKLVETLASEMVHVKLVKADTFIEDFRAVKETSEINAIKKSLLIAESLFKEIILTLPSGISEKEVAWMIEKGLREKGAESVSFSPIVASGPNSALPHAIPTDRKIRIGEPIIFDWGAKLNGYCSDISRTIILGKPDEQFLRIYKTVHEAQQMAIHAIKPGISSKQIDTIARDHIAAKGFKEYFGHGLGHGVGLAIHEPPRISPLKDVRLETGMVFTVEPGIYIPDWGGVRLENMVAVTKKGATVLNTIDCNTFLVDV